MLGSIIIDPSGGLRVHGVEAIESCWIVLTFSDNKSADAANKQMCLDIVHCSLVDTFSELAL